METAVKAHKGPAMEGFIARWYAKNTRGDARGYQECARTIAPRIPAGGSVLDLAAGPGYLAIEVAKLGGYRVFGLDISQTFVGIATDNARAEGVAVEFRQGNAARMPYPDATFDFVVCRAAFKNFTDPLGAIDEIHRVLKPGGKASIFDLRKEASPEEVQALVDGMGISAVSRLWTRWTFRFFLMKNAYTKEAMEELAAASRFGGCEFRQNGLEFEVRLNR
jgi:ubiquinone/menaquinone biosynthesis C-methylase UbiE